MNTETRTQLAAIVVMIIGLVASGIAALELTASGGRNRLTYADVAIEGQPPQVAAGIAMGAFRGVFVNFLWIRANNLKEEGRYYEAMDLAKAITTLQPRFPHVWVFHAWNMAYNISVTTQTPEERWDWVSRGIDLLRKEGIPNNPNDLLIHKELGWFFLHKIGGYLDDANLYYKRQLAGEWTEVLGPPPISDTGMKTFEEVTQEFADWFRPVADAPDTLSELLKAEPRVGELIAAIRAAGRNEINDALVRGYTVLRAMANSGEAELYRRTQLGDRGNRLYELVNDPAWEKEWGALLAHLRKRILIDEYRMEPARMLRYMELYGPVDWRHHAAHGLYWSLRGVENAMLRYTDANKRDFDFVNSNRVVVQALQELWRTGDLYFDHWGWMKDRENSRVFYRASPNIHFIESYGEHLYEFVQRTVDDRVEGRHRSYGVYAAGYENFRRDAIRFLYRRGQRKRAIEMKDELEKWPYHNRNDPERRYLFAMNIDEFVKELLADSLTRPSVVREEVVGAVQGAYLQGVLGGNQEVFDAQMRYAALVHRFFFDNQSYRNHLDPETLRMAQIDPDFRIVAGQEFAALLTMLDLTDAERLYDNSPRDLRVWGYDILRFRFREGMQAALEYGGRPFDEVFPEPPGIEDHRARMQRRDQERRDRMPPVQLK